MSEPVKPKIGPWKAAMRKIPESGLIVAANDPGIEHPYRVAALDELRRRGLDPATGDSRFTEIKRKRGMR